MTTAREVIEATLTFWLNRLSPGETLNADDAAVCLRALNFIADKWNGQKSFLFREILTTSSAITGAFGTLGTDWTGILPGDEILGATVQYSTNLDVPMEPITMGQYANIGIKSLTTYPAYYAHDGQSRVYLYPSASSHIITIRTKQIGSDFADLDTNYGMPQGYKTALSDMLAEKMAFQLLGQIPPKVGRDAAAARRRLIAKNMRPEIIQPGCTRANIITGP